MYIVVQIKNIFGSHCSTIQPISKPFFNINKAMQKAEEIDGYVLQIESNKVINLGKPSFIQDQYWLSKFIDDNPPEHILR